MREIKKVKVAKPLFESAEAGWRTLEAHEQANVTRALANPTRCAILRLLDFGPVRKAELAKQIHTGLGKRYSRSLVQHHLKQLERAGLIGYVSDPDLSEKAKLVYSSARVRIQLKPEPLPEGEHAISEMLIKSRLKREFKEGDPNCQ